VKDRYADGPAYDAGIPTEDTLQKLDLQDVADDLKKMGKITWRLKAAAISIFIRINHGSFV